jgi:putative monooxygenase
MNKLPFIKAADVEGEYRIPPRVSKLLLAPKFGGVENVSMGMNITEVGSMIPDHVHEESEEVLFSSAGEPRL